MPFALPIRSEEHTSELQSHDNLVCRLLLEKKIEVATGPRSDVFGTSPRLVRLAAGRRGCGGQWPRVRGARPLPPRLRSRVRFFFFNAPAATEISALPLPAPLPV